MEDLRRSWKVPYVVYFCNLFENKLDLVDLRIDEFEEALIDDCGFERNIVIVHLLQKLLKAFVIRSIDLTNFESVLLSVLKKYNVEQLFLQSKENNQWSELTMLTKLDIIYTLCEFRLQLGDVELKITEYEPSDLRIEPIGVDSNGNTLWYFGDLRLYEEKPSAKEKEKEKKKEPEPKKKAEKKKPEPPAKKPEPKQQQKAASNAKSTPAKTPSKSAAAATPKSPEKATPVYTGPRPATRSTRSSLAALQQTPQPPSSTPQTPVTTPSLNRSTRSRRREEEAAAAAAAVVEVSKSIAADEEASVAAAAAESQLKLEPEAAQEEATTVVKAEDSVKAEAATAASTDEEEIKVEVEKDEPVPGVNSEQEEALKREEDMKKESDRQQTELYNELVQQAKDERAEKARNRPVIEEKEEYKRELASWTCICMSLEDWTKKADTYKASKKKPDQEIAKILEEAYLPEMPTLFQKAEKERMHRLLAMAPKRQSQRLQVKQQTSTTAAATANQPATDNSTSSLLTNGHSANHHHSAAGPICYTEYSSSDEFDDDNHHHRQASSSGRRNQHSSSMSSLSSHAMLNENGQPMALTEQERLAEKQRHEEIARQREERLKQRLLRREFNGQDAAYLSGAGTNDESQASNGSTSNVKNASSDFNIKNYFLMHKVLNKILAWNYSWPFKNAVSEEDAPNYSTIIQNPMDLSTIQLRINSKAYKSRQAFVQDLELIVENCLTYNGDESFYGKLALKFEHFYKRWLQIFYPREISTSLEEKNRRLMKMLVNRNGGGGGGEEMDDEEAAGNRTDGGGEFGGENGETRDNNENEMNGDGNSESHRALVFDLSDSAMKKKKRRAPDPDRDKYIQEPQYVTKRTSSGRLVKMKIITDYDYTSDQEQEANKKKRRDADEDGVEGIQRKHRKGRHNDEDEDDDGGGDRLGDSPLSDMSDSEASGNGSDSSEDFLGNKSRKSPKRYRTTPAVTRSRGRPVKPMTVSGLLNRAQMNNNNNSSTNNNNNTFVDDDDDEEVVTGRSRSRYVDSDSDEELKDLSKFNHTNHLQTSQQTANTADAADAAARAPLTFEQYVKKLTGSYTLKSAGEGAGATADTTGTATVNGFGFYSGGISIKVAPAQSTVGGDANNSNKAAAKSLNIPLINKSVQSSPSLVQKTSTLGRMTINEIMNSNKQQHQMQAQANAASPNTVKIITMAASQNTTNNHNDSTASPSTLGAAKQPMVATILNGGHTIGDKKFVIINTSTGQPAQSPAAASSSVAQLTTTTTTPNPSNLIKIINLSQLNGSTTVKPVSSLTTTSSPSSSSSSSSSTTTTTTTTIKPQILTPIGVNRPIFMINTTSGIANLKQQQQPATTSQIINAVPIQTPTAASAPAQVPAETDAAPTSSASAATEQQTAVAPPVEPAKENENAVAAAATSLQETLVSLVNNMNEAAESHGSDAMEALGATTDVLKASTSMERLNGGEVINV